jgi:hypothetical protein
VIALSKDQHANYQEPTKLTLSSATLFVSPTLFVCDKG